MNTLEKFCKTYNLQLNNEQKQAVRHKNGACLLLAVPGSGKTTVLIARVGYLILAGGIPVNRILALSYTRASAADMRLRFSHYFGNELAEKIRFQTINGVCASIINIYGKKEGRRVRELLSSEAEQKQYTKGLRTGRTEKYDGK